MEGCKYGSVTSYGCSKKEAVTYITASMGKNVLPISYKREHKVLPFMSAYQDRFYKPERTRFPFETEENISIEKRAIASGFYE